MPTRTASSNPSPAAFLLVPSSTPSPRIAYTTASGSHDGRSVPYPYHTSSSSSSSNRGRRCRRRYSRRRIHERPAGEHAPADLVAEEDDADARRPGGDVVDHVRGPRTWSEPAKFQLPPPPSLLPPPLPIRTRNVALRAEPYQQRD
ncbi:hypothetical protein VTG60DRAFT_1475 [Thermothelomyces hinnuleus]